MRKKIMKTRTKAKVKIKKQNDLSCDATMCFYVVLMIILIPVSVLFLVSAFNVNKTYEKYYLEDGKNVKISTDKSVYSSGDAVTLIIINNSNRPIYSEPCEYLDNFEKKVNGVWIPVNKDINGRIYDKSGFDKKNNTTECKIRLPQAGEGMYRISVQVYYNCQKPGKDMCQGSEIFYSNEFRIVNSK